MLIVQRGRELGYRMSDEQFKRYLDNIKKDNKIESDEQFQAALKQENMTMADLRRNLERQMIVSQRAAERGLGQDRRVRRRGAAVLRRAPEGVHVAADHHAARDLRRRAGGRHLAQRRGRRGRARQGRRRSASARSPARASRSSPRTCRTRRRRPTPASLVR